MVTAIIFIYITLGMLFHNITSRSGVVKNWWWYFALLVDIVAWPLVILMFELKRWKTKK